MDALLGGTLGGIIGLLLVSVVGLVIGGLARFLMPGRDPGGWVATILLGIAGSWIGHFAFASAGIASAGIVGSLVSAVAGAMALLLVYRFLKRA
jgi:uncharacterized membrane protein YeaQ/YmgE (transglycosylase-associated protein family)